MPIHNLRKPRVICPVAPEQIFVPPVQYAMTRKYCAAFGILGWFVEAERDEQ